jgi:hypothetical protein
MILSISHLIGGYDPINYGLLGMINLIAITLMVVAGLGFFYIHYFKTKQKPS